MVKKKGLACMGIFTYTNKAVFIAGAEKEVHCAST